PRRLEARIVVATNQDLLEKQAEGAFRKDLYYRLNIHHVCIPPLRERKQDIPILVDRFLDEAVEQLKIRKPVVSKKILNRLAVYSFPGNVRELKSLIFDAASVCKTDILLVSHFDKMLAPLERAAAGTAGGEKNRDNIFACCEQLPTIQEATELLILEALERSGNNQTIASRMLGISQPALSKRLKHFQKN
nr:helix-turn-helix domain-containing protein [Geobacteraceae bacterium]